MRLTIAVAVATLAAGCASQGDVQVAQAECKVLPITTTSVAGRKPNVSRIEQRYAEAQLATSEYRMRQLRERGLDMNNIEDALRDCATR
jgi:hypothetical protein